jgi:1-acyl-sn-glycerol-3-phosphate acyltransferase
MSTHQRIERAYDHARLEPRRRVLRWMISNFAFRFLVKIDRVEGLENLPASGPGILMINHIAFVDPIVVMGVLPRNVVPLSKVEAYRYPIFGIFPWLWEVIPVHRGEFDRQALRQAMRVLEAGEMVLVAPEGTRHPALRGAKEGVAFLASRSGARLIPVAVEGTVGFPAPPLTPRWRRPGATIRLGRPFRYKPVERIGKEQLRAMTDEAMYVLAAMLPEGRRGEYADLTQATTDTLDFA